MLPLPLTLATLELGFSHANSSLGLSTSRHTQVYPSVQYNNIFVIVQTRIVKYRQDWNRRLVCYSDSHCSANMLAEIYNVSFESALV